MTLRWIGRAAAPLLLATLAALPAAAQDRDLDRAPADGRVFSGTTGTDGAPARYTFTLAAGEAIELSAEPVQGSDPALRVLDAASGELIAENDDADGTLGARVRLYSETTRRVRVEVRNAALEGSAAATPFSLILAPSDYRPKALQPLALGAAPTGTLAQNDEQLFRFDAVLGQTWVFTLSAADGSSLDPALELFAGDTSQGEAIASDDDGGGGLNARLRFTAPQSGRYVLRAYSVGVTEGAYRLVAEEGVPVPPARLETIDLDRPVTARIDGEVRERLYRLSDAAKAALAASAGPLEATMRFVGAAEGALDPIVALGFDTPLGFAAVATDDDGGGGTNAALTLDAGALTPTWLDALRIKASGFLETAGEYELVLSRAGE
jgi:hypothetical protein